MLSMLSKNVVEKPDDTYKDSDRYSSTLNRVKLWGMAYFMAKK